jgi:hypothetical protein
MIFFSLHFSFVWFKKVNDADAQAAGKDNSQGIPAGREGSSAPRPLSTACGSGSSALGFNKRSGHHFPASTTRART